MSRPSPGRLARLGPSMLAALVLCACASPPEQKTQHSPPPEPVTPPDFVPDACQHTLGGPAPSFSAAVGLARAHAKLRFFGPSGDRRKSDAALTAAIAASYPVS